MNPWWSYILTAVGVFGIYLTTKRNWWGYVVGLSAQGLWLTYAITTRQWGFIASAAAYGWVYALGWYRWTRPPRDPMDDGALIAAAVTHCLAQSPVQKLLCSQPPNHGGAHRAVTEDGEMLGTWWGDPA